MYDNVLYHTVLSQPCYRDVGSSEPHRGSNPAGVQMALAGRCDLSVIAARGVAGGFVVTSAAFTPQARAFAAEAHIGLIDGARLALMASTRVDQLRGSRSRCQRLHPTATLRMGRCRRARVAVGLWLSELLSAGHLVGTSSGGARLFRHAVARWRHEVRRLPSVRHKSLGHLRQFVGREAHFWSKPAAR